MTYLNVKLNGIDKDGNEKEYSLLDFKGQEVILYFYPKDNTPGCTQQACDFRDNFNRLSKKLTVIGVSPDNVESHKNFKKEHDLNFILLSDTEHKLAKEFNVWEEKAMNGEKKFGIIRSTFHLDKDGKIQHEWRDVSVKGHVDEVLNTVLK